MLGDEDSESGPPMFTLRGINVAVPDLGSVWLRVEASAGIHVLYGLNGLTIREIAHRHERRIGGITSRIKRLEIER